jgi:hypothetical protein
MGGRDIMDTANYFNKERQKYFDIKDNVGPEEPITDKKDLTIYKNIGPINEELNKINEMLDYFLSNKKITFEKMFEYLESANGRDIGFNGMQYGGTYPGVDKNDILKGLKRDVGISKEFNRCSKLSGPPIYLVCPKTIYKDIKEFCVRILVSDKDRKFSEMICSLENDFDIRFMREKSMYGNYLEEYPREFKTEMDQDGMKKYATRLLSLDIKNIGFTSREMKCESEGASYTYGLLYENMSDKLTFREYVQTELINFFLRRNSIECEVKKMIKESGNDWSYFREVFIENIRKQGTLTIEHVQDITKLEDGI